MTKDWTFSRRIIAGFSAMVVLIIAVGSISLVALNSVVSSKDHVINVNYRLLLDAQSLSTASSQANAANRGFLLTGEKTYRTQLTTARRAFQTNFSDLQANASTATERRLIDAIQKSEKAHVQAVDALIVLRTPGISLARIDHVFSSPADLATRNQLDSTITAFVANEENLLASARQASTNDASTATTLVLVIAIAAVILAAVFAFFLTRSLRRRIATAVGEMRSSSAELQATANQQASGAKEQATAMSEISTTISELLATSRQIAESAQRVAQVADQTAGAGRKGEVTVNKAQASITDIRRQVDVIVDHMLELGEKSQRIGAVLDIVTELAEQTNILAINSTIEAAGAGEAGKRFAVVADEIRKLADRVADSTKEIRGLIDVVRSAVNTTVMAIEIGSKAVDAGSEQFRDVTKAFDEIATLVSTTTDAAREIELSTKQQSTAVEQVNVAISNVAQSTQEAEVSSNETYQTASQLTALSESLGQLVEAQAAGQGHG
jgi:methyl-accepting chemotaxis protein